MAYVRELQAAWAAQCTAAKRLDARQLRAVLFLASLHVVPIPSLTAGAGVDERSKRTALVLRQHEADEQLKHVDGGTTTLVLSSLMELCREVCREAGDEGVVLLRDEPHAPGTQEGAACTP
jgi:hypothetical protein